MEKPFVTPASMKCFVKMTNQLGENTMRIMFMGTPDFAAHCLEKLIADGYEVCSVVTRADAKKDRGQKIKFSPVKEVALANNLPVYQPLNLKEENFREILEKENPDLVVVVAYGRILPPYVLSHPKYGCINVHASLLPKYRGSAPIQYAVAMGEQESGVTIMQMNEGLDTGDIISQSVFPISDEDDFEAIHDRSYEVGGPLLVSTIADIEAGRATRTPQNEDGACYAAKIEKSDCKLDFTMPAAVLDPIIRGVTPIPGAFCYRAGKMLKINRARPVKGKGAPGEVIAVDPKGDGSFTVACGEGALLVTSVIPEGKGKMSAGDLLRGRRLALGDVLD